MVFILLVLSYSAALLLCTAFADTETETCDALASPQVPWRDFNWRSYIAKDMMEEEEPDPVTRFGINLTASIGIGAHRDVPDFR